MPNRLVVTLKGISVLIFRFERFHMENCKCAEVDSQA